MIGLLGLEHQAVTHLTGTTSMLSAAVARLDLPDAAHYAAIIGAFLAGTAFSGVVVQDSTLRLGRRYGAALLAESSLLCVAGFLLCRHNSIGLYFASCACGLQNAMVSTYSGAVVRTTHVSGMFTDLGIFLGHSLRGIPVDRRRLRLCALVISGFFCGGIVGTLSFHAIGYAALFLPATLTALVGLTYGLYEFFRNR